MYLYMQILFYKFFMQNQGMNIPLFSIMLI